MNQELYDLIHDQLASKIDISEEETSLLIHELTVLAVSGAEEYVSELTESISFLRETIKRLTDEKISLLGDLKRRESS